MSALKLSHNFAVMGVAGFVAPRHLRAIEKTGNKLIAALDPFDGVGVLDSYFPEASFFTEPERFDRHLDKLRRGGGEKVDYVSICSPNYLHDAHIRLALRNHAHAICEKPLVLNPWNVDALQALEKESGHRIYSILQLRYHPAILKLKRRIESDPTDRLYDIELSYITARGAWYQRSWKGDIEKSGGIATNIGVHFFDMLSWIFGPKVESTVHAMSASQAAGLLRLQRARIKWFLSISSGDLPTHVKQQAGRAYRSLKIDGDEVEFSDGFTDLHTVSYESILKGEGFGISDARASIEIVQEIRGLAPVGLMDDFHPLLLKDDSRQSELKKYANQ